MRVDWIVDGRFQNSLDNTASRGFATVCCDVFISAGLMFLVEPMVAKMVLPQLGGSRAVWTTCLVFFQATLLLGYAYAHALSRVAPRRAQILIHVAVLLPLAALSLPLNISANLPPQGAWPVLSLLVRLTLVLLSQKVAGRLPLGIG